MRTFLYSYDPLDRLIESAGSQRFYNKTRLATEIQGTVQCSVFQVGDQLLGEWRGKGASNLLATDLQRSVLHTVSADKNHAIAYDVYGHRPADSGVSHLLAFNGERPDPVTGHYLLGNGYRAFNPVLMRFNSPDSWSPFGSGGVNGYGYCGGDSVNRSDASGHLFDYLLRRYASLFGSRGLKEGLTPSFLHEGAAAGEKLITFTNVKQLSPGSFFAEKEVSNALPQLVISGHGSFDAVGGYIGDSGRKLRFNRLKLLLKARGIKPERYSSAHFMVCHSASGGENALAFAFNKEYGIPTVGYEGRVVTQNDPMGIFTSHMPDVGGFYRRAQKIRVMTVAEGTDVIKALSDIGNPSAEIARGFNYKPVWFR